jgi:hypothetical protein
VDQLSVVKIILKSIKPPPGVRIKRTIENTRGLLPKGRKDGRKTKTLQFGASIPPEYGRNPLTGLMGNSLKDLR